MFYSKTFNQLKINYQKNKHTPTQINQMVLNYQQTKDNRLESIIWDNMALLLYREITRITSDEEIIKDILGELYIKFKAHLLPKYTNKNNFNSFAISSLSKDIFTIYNTKYKHGTISFPTSYTYLRKNAEKYGEDSKYHKYITTKTISIDKPIYDDNKTSIGDMLPSNHTNKITTIDGLKSFEDVYFKLIKPKIMQRNELIKKGASSGRFMNLTKNTDMFELYYGLGYDYQDKLNMDEIGELTGSTKQAVHQIIRNMRLMIKDIILKDSDLREIIQEIVPEYTNF